MRAFIYDKHAAVLRDDGLCELFIADVTAIDQLRAHDMARLGLPPDATMLALWNEAQRIVLRADLTRVPDLTESPYLLFIDRRTGTVVSRWQAFEPWSTIRTKLQEGRHAA